MLTRRAMLAAAAMAPVAAQAAGAAPTPPSIDELLREPDVHDAAISPDGEQLAILRTQVKDGKKNAYVTLSRLADLSARPDAAIIGEQSVSHVEWANNERLLIWITFHKDERGQPYGLWFYDTFVPVPVKRVISVDLKGQDPVVMFAGSRSVLRRGFDASRVVDYLKDDPRRVLMQAWNDSRGAYGLFQVDVYTGAAELVEQGVAATDFWLTQGGVPMLRMDSNARGTIGWVYGRAPGEKDWKLIRKSRFTEGKKLPDFDVVGPTPEAGVFLVCQRMEGRDTSVIRTFDLASQTFGDVIAERPDRDFETCFVDENLKLVASAYWDDRLNYEFADPALAPHFRAVNAALKNTCNVQLYDIDVAHKRMLFRATGPQEPGSFQVYDRQTRRLEYVGHCKPWLTPERLAKGEALKVRTRDGAEIPAYLTVPIQTAGKPLPMVVMPHGGPEVRDYLDYDLTAQALAARGWLVLQPNFRGSGGYGRAFAEQGRRQWADRMQADVEDAVDQLVTAGRADPKRLAILGASYGGYSALMGAVRRPDLYRAVVSIAGDADLIESLAFSRREDGADSPTYAYWRASMGDPRADEDLLIRASPARRVAEIQAPVLLIHGTEDTIVDPKQSRLMAKALKAAGKTCDLVELNGEGHRGWSDATWKTVLETATAFIGKHI
ncbi:MAG: S9 family peptidase [Phenylobacterium sp.]|uniref:alpha/beta hydrolase family protein n=1 Tax=Phenylobacterium sp. TaxID=1871053 RepID=UPI001A32BA60|nr:S9 family peptidase [Phenylobacterium sp.]MBJ7410970.1 S9 family peptidase [Phenylobacterium sp.]